MLTKITCSAILKTTKNDFFFFSEVKRIKELNLKGRNKTVQCRQKKKKNMSLL